MASNTPAIGLYKKDPVADANTNFNITTMLNENWDKIDEALGRPFFAKSYTYDAGNNRIAVVLSKGSAEFIVNGAAVLVQKLADETYLIPAPAINTTYYIYIKSDGTYTHNTTGVPPAGSLRLWTVATGAAVSTLTRADKRFNITGISAEMVKHLEDNAAHGEVASLYRSAKDANDIFTILEWKRADGTLFKKSVLSGGVSPKYTTRTLTYYEADGTTVKLTKTFALTYDAADLLIQEVLT